MWGTDGSQKACLKRPLIHLDIDENLNNTKLLQVIIENACYT